MLNPDTNMFERVRNVQHLKELQERWQKRKGGTNKFVEAPTFSEGERIEIRGYIFRISHIGRKKMIIRPVRPA